MKIRIVAVGRHKPSPTLDLCREYLKRLSWDVALHEIDVGARSTPAREAAAIKPFLAKAAVIIALDERGESLSSLDFAARMEGWRAHASGGALVFVIGGADGLDDEIRKHANVLLSFGKQTWPHMLVRVMLLEQIYRAQQIAAGHPYHRP